MYITYQFRIKDSTSRKHLVKLASSVNFLWNYCNAAACKQYKYYHKWLNKHDLMKLTSGTSKELNIHSQTIQAICEEYSTRRIQFRKLKLKGRSYKRSLGWIPFKLSSIKVKNDSIKYQGRTYKFWKSREIEGEIKSGSFSQNSKGQWFVNLTCEVDNAKVIKPTNEVGIDLGLKTQLTLSDGTKYSRENITNKYAKKLAMAQRAKKKKLVSSIHNKMKNTRKDWNHKVTNELVNRYTHIYVGNVKSNKIGKTNMAKSCYDSTWYQIKSMLEYKAIKLGIEFKEVNESYSTITCSACGSRHGPSGLRGLGVRLWICSSCSTAHDRDVNAAINILTKARDGHVTPITGIPKR